MCGYVLFHAFFRLIRKEVPSFWTKSYFLGKIALSFATINIAFFIWSAIGYLFTLPPVFLGISFAVTVIFSIFYAIRYLREGIIESVKNTIRAATNLRFFSWVAAAFAVLVLDFVLNIQYGSYIAGDALIHISNVRDLAENGFRFIDPAYGTIDATYLFVIWHVLMAIPSYLGVDALNVWLYSLPIAKLAILSSVCFLLQQLLENMAVSRRHIRTWVYSGALLFLLLPSAANSFTAPYPNKMVLAWIALLMAGVLLFINQRKAERIGAAVLIFASSALIAATHPLYSAFAFLLMVIAGGIFILFERGRIRTAKDMVATWLGSLFILMLAPLVNTLINRGGRTTELEFYNDNFQHWELFGMKAFVPTFYGLTSPVPDLLIYIAGFLGFACLLLLAKGKINKVFIGCMALFPMLAVIPPIFETMNNVLPEWAIERMLRIDVIVYIILVIAVSGLATLLHRYKSLSLPISTTTAFMMVGLVSYLFISQNIENVMSNRDYIPYDNSKKTRENNQLKKYKMVTDIRKAVHLVPSGSVVVARTGESVVLPAVAPVRVFTIPIGHTNSLVLDIEQRISCTERIFNSKNSAEEVAGYLVQINASYIMLLKGSRLNKTVGESEKFTRLTKPAQKYQLYRLNPLSIRPSVLDAVCNL